MPPRYKQIAIMIIITVIINNLMNAIVSKRMCSMDATCHMTRSAGCGVAELMRKEMQVRALACKREGGRGEQEDRHARAKGLDHQAPCWVPI